MPRSRRNSAASAGDGARFTQRLSDEVAPFHPVQQSLAAVTAAMPEAIERGLEARAAQPDRPAEAGALAQPQFAVELRVRTPASSARARRRRAGSHRSGRRPAARNGPRPEELVGGHDAHRRLARRQSRSLRRSNGGSTLDLRTCTVRPEGPRPCAAPVRPGVTTISATSGADRRREVDDGRRRGVMMWSDGRSRRHPWPATSKGSSGRVAPARIRRAPGSRAARRRSAFFRTRGTGRNEAAQLTLSKKNV